MAKTNGQLLRCHNLLWYQEAPSWLTSTTWTNASLIAAIQTHITNEVTHYKGQCYAWDVVNEALNDDGTFRSWTVYNTIGPAYIPIAFAAAAAADPSAKLYYNDYNIESAGAKATAAQNLVKMIKAYGAKIDGIGLESHFIVGETPSASAQASNMAAFTALGVEVAVTELDVRQTLPETAAQDQQQATDYVSTVTACLQTKNCVGVTVSNPIPPSIKSTLTTLPGLGLRRQILLGPLDLLGPRRRRPVQQRAVSQASIHIRALPPERPRDRWLRRQLAHHDRQADYAQHQCRLSAHGRLRLRLWRNGRSVGTVRRYWIYWCYRVRGAVYLPCAE